MENEKEQKEEKQDFQKFSLDGDTYKTLLTKKWLNRKPYVENDPGKIMSFIPGTILKVLVRESKTAMESMEVLVTLDKVSPHHADKESGHASPNQPNT